MLRTWVKKLHNAPEDDAALVNEFGPFTASYDDVQSDIWTYL